MKSNKLLVNNGQRFGMLTIIKETDHFIQPSGQTQRAFICKCDCGKLTKVRLSHLIHNRIKSCGCLVGEKHGECFSNLYNIWRGMKNRCNDIKYSERHLYGGRGINICSEWNESFINFRDWANQNDYKKGLTIDRINNNGNYEPNNCRFVTQFINNNNRRNTFFVNYNGKKIAFTMLVLNKGLNEHSNAIRTRIMRGWDHNKAFDIPIRKGNYKRNYV